MFNSRIYVYFWSSYPALFYGVSMLLGMYFTFYSLITLIIPMVALWLPFILTFRTHNAWRPLLLSLALFGATWLFATSYYTFPMIPAQGLRGEAHLSIQTIRLQKSFFSSHWHYQCQIKNFFPEHAQHSIARHFSCTLSIAKKPGITRPLADREYLVKGILMQRENGTYLLKIDPLQPWKGVANSWSLTEARHSWKKTVAEWIDGHFSAPFSASLLRVLATGEFDDQWMRHEFARFGLQHIMAISGFHFAILACLLSLIMRLFFQPMQGILLLLVCLSGYAIFLGPNPSVLRAWIMCTVAFAGQLFEKNALALNGLGIGLMGVLCIDPLFCQTIGFQFSFLITAAILLLFGPVDNYLCRILTKRRLSEMIEMNGWNQHGYCVLVFLRQAIALLIAVNAFAVPLTLYYFHQFPVMSLLYNLFFPLLISGSMVLLILGILTVWVPLLGWSLNQLNNFYTDIVLKLTYGMPDFLDHHWKVESLSKELLVAYLTGMFLIAILLKESVKDLEVEEHFSYL